MTTDVELPEVRWTDRSQRPIAGMLVTAYFKGELRTNRLTEWCRDFAYFADGYRLHWIDDIGFRFH